MAFRKKKEVLSPELAELESALATKIREIEKISDPIEQLFQYKALRESRKVKYDKTKVLPAGTEQHADSRHELIMGWGANVGVWGGLALGISLVATTVLTGGFAGLAGAGFLGTSLLASHLAGNKRKQSVLGSPEEKHATRMSEMAAGIDAAVERLTGTFKNLTSTYQNEDSMAILARSSHFDEIKKTFPEIATEFNRQAKMAAQQAAFLTQEAAPSPATTRLLITNPANNI